MCSLVSLLVIWESYEAKQLAECLGKKQTFRKSGSSESFLHMKFKQEWDCR